MSVTNTKGLPKALRNIHQQVEDLRKQTNAEGGNRNEDGKLKDQYANLLDDYKKLMEEKKESDAATKRQQQAYQMKEMKFREHVGTLEDRIRSLGVEDTSGDSRMIKIHEMHDKIQDRIGKLQHKTTKVLQDQERDLIRAFRIRLLEVSQELQKERKKNESGSVEWVAKCKKLTEELEWFRDLTDKLTAENKNVLKENRRYKRQLKTQEEDREFLIKQLVSVKKENARLRYSFDQANFSEKERERIGLNGQTPPLLLSNESRSTGTLPRTLGRSAEKKQSRPRSSGSKRLPSPMQRGIMVNRIDPEDKDQRYQALITKLQKQLEAEQKKHRALRTSHTHEIANRTVLQNFLKKCIEDVRQDIADRRRRDRRQKGLPPAPVDPRTIPLEEFTPADRINVMEWLLSQDHVIYLLYEKMFPRPVNEGSTQAAIGRGSPDRMSRSGGNYGLTPPRSNMASPF